MSDTTTPTRTPDTTSSPAIVVDDLSVTYEIYADERPTLRRMVARGNRRGRVRKVEAVKHATFVVYPGESVGVIGPNGSGKSTMLRAMAGLLPATTGKVYARALPVLLGVKAALNSDLSARRNVYLGGTALGMTIEQLDDMIDDIVEFAGVEDYIELPLRAFSSGMAARLQFAIATAVTPEVLMIDEALAVGDEEFREKSAERIRQLIGDAGTLFLVTHSMDSVLELCERVIWIEDGVIRGDGDPEPIVEQYREAWRARKRAREQADAHGA